MLKMGKCLKLAAVLALLLVLMTQMAGAAGNPSDQYYGLWHKGDGRFYLMPGGKGVFYEDDGSASTLTWEMGTRKSGKKTIPCIEIHASMKEGYGGGYVLLPDSDKHVSDLYQEDYAGRWVSDETELYLFGDGSCILKTTEKSGKAALSHGRWLNAGKQVFLMRDAFLHHSGGNTEYPKANGVLTLSRTKLTGTLNGQKVTFAPEMYAADGLTCPLCNGDRIVESDCSACTDGNLTCISCGGKGTDDQCSRCSGTGSHKCASCSGTGRCSYCGGSGRGKGGISCFCVGKGICKHCDGKGRDACNRCGGTGWEQCDICDGTGNSLCIACYGRKTKLSNCLYCNGKGTLPAPSPTPAATPTPKPTATPTPRPTATPGPRVTFTQKNGGSCSGAAWNAASPSCGKDVLSKLTRNYALEITFSASGNGHVWLCLPQSKAGWTGIGQQNPIIRGNTVIIPYDTVVKAAGASYSWGKQLYIKGSTDWKVTQLRVIYWPD